MSHSKEASTGKAALSNQAGSEDKQRDSQNVGKKEYDACHRSTFAPKKDEKPTS